MAMLVHHGGEVEQLTWTRAGLLAGLPETLNQGARRTPTCVDGLALVSPRHPIST